jgi:hypothetical protein
MAILGGERERAGAGHNAPSGGCSVSRGLARAATVRTMKIRQRLLERA